MEKANRILFYLVETEAQKVNKTKQIIGNALGHLVSTVSLQRPKQMKASGYSAALKFKVCHRGSLHLKLPALNIFVLLTHPWLNRELSDLARVPDSQRNYVQIRAS